MSQAPKEGTSGIKSKKTLSVIILVSSSFAWLFLFFINFTLLFPNIVSNTFMVDVGYLVFLGFCSLSAMIGSWVSEKVNRRKFLITWIIFGLLANISLAFSRDFGLGYFFFISGILGIACGIGFPTCLAFLTSYTTMEQRARVTGITISITLVIVILTFVVGAFLSYGLEFIILLCAVRSTSFAALASDRYDTKEEKTHSWRAILNRQDFTLYLIPWVMFSVAGGLQFWIFTDVPSSYGTVTTIGSILHYAGWAIFCVVAGVMADRIGRKQPLIIGLVMLGLGYAFLSLGLNPLTIVVYYAFSGLAWGALFTVYITVLGDLSFSGSRERFFALGAIMPLIISLGFQAMATIFNVYIDHTLLSVLLSIILFVSILPVLQASETLSNKRIRERKMKEYADKIGKLVHESEEANDQ